MNFNDDLYTTYTVSNRNVVFTIDESRLPQPGEIIKVNDQDGDVRLCQVESFKRVSGEGEWIADYDFVLVLLPTGITFPMRAGSDYWATVQRATDLEGLATAGDA
jgi:hypothetical protein